MNYEKTLRETGVKYFTIFLLFLNEPFYFVQIKFKSLNGDGINEILPNTSYFNYKAIYDDDAGLLFADKAVKSFQVNVKNCNR